MGGRLYITADTKYMKKLLETKKEQTSQFIPFYLCESVLYRYLGDIFTGIQVTSYEDQGHRP